MTLGKLGSGGDEQEQGGTGSTGGIDFRLSGSCQREEERLGVPCHAISPGHFPEARLCRALPSLIREAHCHSVGLF